MFILVPLTQNIGYKFIVVLGFGEKCIQTDGLTYIGKEANNIEDQPLDVDQPQTLINVEEVKQKILDLTPEEARNCLSADVLSIFTIFSAIVFSENCLVYSNMCF